MIYYAFNHNMISFPLLSRHGNLTDDKDDKNIDNGHGKETDKDPEDDSGAQGGARADA